MERMIPPTELIAHAIPRLLEEHGLRPHAPVGDEVVFEGEIAGDPFWVMLTPMPREAAGARRAMESLAARFQPSQPPTRRFGLLVLLCSTGADPDLAALAATPPREGTQPVLRAVAIDLADAAVHADLGGLRPMTQVVKTLEKGAKAALAGERPPDLGSIVDQQVALSQAYRAARPWATWAIVASVGALVVVQRHVDPLKKLRLDKLLEGVWRWDLVLANTMIYPAVGEMGIDVVWLVLTVIGVLSLGSLVERLYGRAAFLSIWFLPSLLAAYASYKLSWGIWASPVSAMFGMTGATLAMGFLRTALPWSFRKSLLSGSAPMIVIFALMVFLSGMGAASIGAVVVAGGLLAAVLPFRAPITPDGGPIALRAATWGLAIACLGGVGLAVQRAWLRAEEAPKPTKFVSEEGWSVTAPPGYRVETPEGGGTTLTGGRLQITIQTMPIDAAEPLDRYVREIRQRWRRHGAWFSDEKEEIHGRVWWRLRIRDADGSEERYLADVEGLRVAIEASGEHGAVRDGERDVRSVVESFRASR